MNTAHWLARTCKRLSRPNIYNSHIATAAWVMHMNTADDALQALNTTWLCTHPVLYALFLATFSLLWMLLGTLSGPAWAWLLLQPLNCNVNRQYLPTWSLSIKAHSMY
jgi:hypothetical protein